jgi:hypothetical protein
VPANGDDSFFPGATVPESAVSRDRREAGRRTSQQMPSIVTGACLAALVLVGAAGCLGNQEGAKRTGESRETTAAGGFEKLESRPLHFPRVTLRGPSIREHGVAGRCVEEPAGIAVNAIVLPHIPGVAALGPVGARARYGPVYAALPEGAPRIVLLSLLPTVRASRWHLVRTIWISSASYDGPVLVRGGRLDQAGVLGFGDGLPPRTSLRLPAGGWPLTRLGSREGGSARQAGWRVTAIPTLVRAPGCYAFQVDGLGFSYVLAFGAQSR